MGRLYQFKKGKVTKEMKKVTIFDVAAAFLSMESMTHKKLQKLCYYAQAWHLALLKDKLFDDHFEAWVHGPVNPDLYHSYKIHGWLNIPKNEVLPDNIDAETYAFLNLVYDTYGEFSGDQLEALTHAELPWKEAREGLEEWEPCNRRIDEKTMKNFYWKRYEQSQND